MLSWYVVLAVGIGVSGAVVGDLVVSGFAVGVGCWSDAVVREMGASLSSSLLRWHWCRVV